MFNWMMNHEIVVKRSNGINRDGEPQYNPAEAIKGRFEHGRKIVRDRNGIEVISNTTLFTHAELDDYDLVFVNDRYFSILQIAPQFTALGELSHYEVSL